MLSKEISLDFFRICQQVLLHVSQHANTGKVKILISEKAGKIILVIDGVKGDELAASGVISIQERAVSFGGRCIVEENRVLVTT
jgi:signal transduction histidine kinase